MGKLNTYSFATMSKRMKDNLPYLQILAKCKPKVRRAIIDHGPIDVIIGICECSYNLLKRRYPLIEKSEATPVKVQETSPQLGRQKSFAHKKKRLLNQKGGSLLTVLLPPVLSVLGSSLMK